MRWCQLPSLAAVLLLCYVAVLAADPPPIQTDEQLLKGAGVPTDGPGLVQFFRRRALQDSAADKIKELIRRLGDDDFEVREKASDALLELRHRAVPFLMQARSSPEPEVVRRAEDCLRQIGGGGAVVGVDTAAARVLAARKPPGATEALLAFLPVADSDALAEEIIDALAAMARAAGRPDKALVAALGDKLPVRRAAAALALCRAGLLAQEPGVRKAVLDADLSVRLRAALALAVAGDKNAVPVLIDLLTKSPMEGAWEAEDCLLRLAAPATSVPLRLDASSRKKCRDAWAAWWAANEGRANLSKLKPDAPKGVTLVVLLDEGTVREVDAKGKTLWEVKEISFPLDAQLLPGDRVLVAEHANNCVTERDRTGKVLWKKDLPLGPLAAHRLADGNTFIATSMQMIEVNKDGKEVRQYVLRNGEGIRKAQRLRNGDVGCVTAGNRFVRLDRDGKELVSFPVDVATNGGRIDVLANGHVLVPQMNQNRVVEYNTEGKPVWEATVEQPIAAVRLPNGQTLVTSLNQHRAVELDRGGRVIWDYRSNSRVTRAFRR